MLALLACLVSIAPIAASQDAAMVEVFEPRPVTVVAADGASIAEITIGELEDPFLEYEPKSSPQRGFRLVVVSIAVENISSHLVIFNPTHVFLVDEQGFLASSYNIVTLPHIALTMLIDEQLEPGERIAGSITFQVLNGVGISEVLYAPSGDRTVSLARLNPDPPLGTPVQVVDNDGSPIAEIVVDTMGMPFTGFDEKAPPQRGSDFALVTVTVKNSGVRPMKLDPNAFALIDKDGFLVRPLPVKRVDPAPPDLTFTNPFEAGDELTGAIGFLVLRGVTLDSVVYTPAKDRFIELADLSEPV
jgi:hypothetical protein